MKTVTILSDKGEAVVEARHQIGCCGTAIPSREKNDFWTFQQRRASTVENART